MVSQYESEDLYLPENCERDRYFMRDFQLPVQRPLVAKVMGEHAFSLSFFVLAYELPIGGHSAATLRVAADGANASRHRAMPV